MSLTDKTGYRVIADARAIFLEHYKDSEFLQAVEKHRGFSYTRDSSVRVANKIRNANCEMQLTTFNAPKSRAIASTSKKNGVTIISFNEAMLGDKSKKYGSKLLEQRVETLMHEFLHGVGYRHFTNYNWSYNRKTVPYKAAELFVKNLKERSILA